jgi:hypothetical protein
VAGYPLETAVDISMSRLISTDGSKGAGTACFVLSRGDRALAGAAVSLWSIWQERRQFGFPST